MPGPLSHLKVLDLSRVMAGPWASQVLADLGAEVIKVEQPGTGDDTRGWGPPFLKDKEGNATRESGYFLACNRGKKSITVNLKTPEGQELVRRLTKQSDILLENFKVGTLERFGLDYDSLKELNPGLIYCSITGFGQTGPRSKQVAYDFLIQAMGGLMSITGEADGKPGAGPQKIGVPMVDLTTGLYSVIGILAAVANRNVTGKGDYVDVGMLDVQTSLLANQAMNHLLTGNTPKRYGNGHPNIMPQQVFACKDGYMVLAVGNDGQFRRLCEALGDNEMLKDDRLTYNKGRVEHRDELLGRLANHFGKYDRADLLARLNDKDVPSGPINTVPEVFEEPQIKAREMQGNLDHPLSGSVPQVFGPIRMAGSKTRATKAPPLLGADTTDVLKEAGYSDEDIAAMQSAGVL
ncbi:CaiB/BaiF CoA transferase family protein [Roseibium limicola]|uniref:CoA transferase n=1 Tax=Roseibium limicola TaxID=2816037 RepID=A0A939EKP9_9HYPH|nr:CaiB/BaiF CoA-transferase family protein [Roseibium limicola]MBO0344248.1 CoA transferase [Roseibium limicola]